MTRTLNQFSMLFSTLLAGAFAPLAITFFSPSQLFGASPAIEFVFSEYQATEGQSALSTNARTACLQLRRTGYVAGETWSVDYEIIPGTAQPGEDFTGPLTGTIDFTMGNDFRCLPIPLINDGAMEPPKTLTVQLVSAVGAMLTANRTATLTIMDDDGPVEWAALEWKAREGAGSVEVQLRRNDNGPFPITVQYVLTDGSAIGGEDFVPGGGTVSFEPGERLKSVTVSLLDDCLIEPDEWLGLAITSVEGGATWSTNSTARLIILDDERPGSFDPAFDGSVSGESHGWGAGATLPDGKLLAGVNVPDGKIIRFKRDGSVDENFASTNFGPALPPEMRTYSNVFVDRMLVQPDGRILVGCRNMAGFPECGFTTNGLLRLHPDGTLDSSFNADPRLNGGWFECPPTFSVGAFLFQLQSDGKVIVGRPAVWSDDALGRGLVRLHPDGSLDLGFQTPFEEDAKRLARISAIGVQPDGRILVAASARVAGANFSGILRLQADGSMDEGFQQVSTIRQTSGYIFDSPPTVISVQSDGRIVLAGGFNLVNGVPRRAMARLMPDGVLDTDFDPTAELPISSTYITDFVLDARERIVIAGPVALALTGSQFPVARLLPDGKLDPAFQMNEHDLTGTPEQLLLTADGEIVFSRGWSGLYRLNGDPAPHLSWERRPDANGWSLSVPTITGDSYILEGTLDFQAWEAIETRVADGCSLDFHLPGDTTHRFYRAERRPAP
jgi:uncharacterized delta-60 repeat protein